MRLTRRDLLALGAVVAWTAGRLEAPALAQEGAQDAAAVPSVALGPEEPFSPAMVRVRARELAQQPYEPPPAGAAEPLRDLSYDQYRDIRFRPDAAIWRGEELPVQLQLFHLGHVYSSPVMINLVENGSSRHVIYSPELFSYGPLVPDQLPTEDIGFSGFRLHGALNEPDRLDEFAVFQGASYFRAIARGQTYGLSARGLSIRTAEPEGEEFPAFREFWIERPRADSNSVVVHALLDSPGTTGAYRMTIRPGTDTVIDVEATLFPRADIEKIGLAPLTSMFFFAPHDRAGVDDFRPSVHDSDGLLMWNGRGEWLWRPLINPARLEISAFLDDQPQGFGLMQRGRDFQAYQDLEARYERRPSLWVEPIGNWGAGSVILVEIPTNAETYDNIVAFWRPAEPLRAGEDYLVTYRLFWGAGAPVGSGLAKVVDTRVGRPTNVTAETPADRRLIVIDYAGGPLAELPPDAEILPEVWNSAGRLVPGTIQFNPATGGRRVAFGLDPSGRDGIDLRCTLKHGGEAISEVWVYRWSA